jgi:ubiquinone biosynthesis protein
MPGEIAVLLTTLGVLEGVAQQIDPGFKVIDAARPFAQAVFMQSLGPQAWRREAARSLRRYRKLADDLPVALTRTLRRASEGEFQVAVRPEHFDDVTRAVKDVANRLALAIVVAAFVLAFAYISARETLPDWIRWAAGTVLGLAALMALGLLAAIVVALLRRRRH